MKIGTRLLLTTLCLVVATLGIYGLVTVRQRHAEVVGDLERQTALVGTAVQITFDAAIQEGLFEDVSGLLKRWQAAEPGVGISYFDLLDQKSHAPPPAFTVADPDADPVDGGAPYVLPPSDPSRSERLLRARIEGTAIGEHVDPDGRATYVLTIPIRDKTHAIVGALELRRDESDVTDALSESSRRAIVAIVLLMLILAPVLWLLAHNTMSRPLTRLIEAVDDVTRGDLGRVILREHNDEIGDLADRFNAMTGSLRDARTQIMAGVDARITLEARLRHSEKLATIGQLAAGIAHEVGTPLNVIGGRARALEKKAQDAANPPPSAEVAKNSGIIAAQAQRITRIIQRLLDFARRPESVRAGVNLERVAADCLDFLEHQMAQHRVDVFLTPFVRGEGHATSTPYVIADADQIQQVCLNLFVNALEAMPDGGKMYLTTTSIERRRPGLDVASPGRYVVLEVADTGGGIVAADRERIFEPFYSTKGGDAADDAPSAQGERSERSGGGTGLGLAVSAGIIKDHDGWIELDERPGGGARFRVFLPAQE